MGDPGARLLSKSLQINTSLKTLSIDRNNITVHGYSDIAYSLERYAFYYSRKFMHLKKEGKCNRVRLNL